MGPKSKFTVLTMAIAVLATSSISAFADSEMKKSDKTMFKAMLPLDYETAAERHLEITGEELNEETFNKMIEAHELMKEGDREGAKAIMDELGIAPPHKVKIHMNRGDFIPNLTDEQKEIFKQIRELKKQGDLEAIKELLEENEIEFFGKFHRKFPLQREG